MLVPGCVCKTLEPDLYSAAKHCKPLSECSSICSMISRDWGKRPDAKDHGVREALPLILNNRCERWNPSAHEEDKGVRLHACCSRRSAGGMFVISPPAILWISPWWASAIISVRRWWSCECSAQITTWMDVFIFENVKNNWSKAKWYVYSKPKTIIDKSQKT